MRRKMLAPLAALFGVLLLVSPGWAPPPVFRPAPPPPPVRPPSMPVRPPTSSVPRVPGTTALPGTGRLPSSGVRPPIYVPPNFGASLEAARRRNAAEAAELLRQQSAASLGRAHRAALLNAVTHDMLRQQQAASLADLRRLRADWVAVGPGAGLDPVIAMQLEAAESAAERLLLAEILQLVTDGKFAAALAKFEPLESPRYLPAAVVLMLPELRAALVHVAPFASAQADLKRNAPFPAAQALWGLNPDRVPPAVKQPLAAWWAVAQVRNMLADDRSLEPGRVWRLQELTGAVLGVEKACGPALAGRLRAELAAVLFMRGRNADAAVLLEDGVDPVHAAAVLADLKAIMLGRGAVATPQVATLIPETTAAPPRAVAILPPERVDQWVRPARPAGATTAETALAAEVAKLVAAVGAELATLTPKVTAAADRIRAALAAEAAPLKAFLAKVEVARGRPFATPAEAQLAVTAGARGLTVAEVVGVFAVEADRPAAAARSLATIPAVADVGGFAVAAEMSGRAPAGFAPHPDAAFKLPPTADRARVRAMVGASLHAQAGAVVAGREGLPFDRAALEADVHKRLGLAPEGVLAPAEFVQGLLDVCRDWSDERVRLAEALQGLNEAVTDIEAGEYGPDDDELKELTTVVKMRRLSVQTDKKRREVGLGIGCRLLGAYGADAAPAREWLRTQAAGDDTPWRQDAVTAVEKTGAK